MFNYRVLCIGSKNKIIKGRHFYKHSSAEKFKNRSRLEFDYIKIFKINHIKIGDDEYRHEYRGFAFYELSKNLSYGLLDNSNNVYKIFSGSFYNLLSSIDMTILRGSNYDNLDSYTFLGEVWPES